MVRLGYFLLILALGVWLGAMTFFSFAAAPIAFSVLEREAAGRLVSAVFPIYYAVGGGLGVVGLVVSLVMALGARRGRPLLLGIAALLLLAVALTVYAGVVLLPETQEARAQVRAAPADAGASLEFTRLHQRAVVLNLVVMLAVLAALGLAVLALPAWRGS